MLKDLFSAMKVFAEGPSPQLARTEVGPFIVSTIVSPDCGPETALIDAVGAHPVKRYETMAAALEGHAKWVQVLQDGKRTFLKLGYGTSVRETWITLKS